MKFYDFVDRAPDIGTLAFVEGTERELADRAVALLIDRLLPPEARDFNLQRFDADALDDFRAVGEALQAMPFLGERRVVVVNGAHTLKADPRRDLSAIAQSVPAGNTLIVVNLVSPNSKRPVPIGASADKEALRIDTSALAPRRRSDPPSDVRKRFVAELLERLGATAEARVINELSRSDADLSSIRNDLEKLTVNERRISYAAFVRESLAVEDPKMYEFSSAAIDGRTSKALAVLAECFEDNPRSAIPLLSALARESLIVWEVARSGKLPEGVKSFRERPLQAIASTLGARRARMAYDLAVGTFEAIVTGKSGGDTAEQRVLMERLAFGLGEMKKQAENAGARARR